MVVETTRAKLHRKGAPARRIVPNQLSSETSRDRGRPSGKTAVAVITPKLVYRINGDAQDVCDMPVETTTDR